MRVCRIVRPPPIQRRGFSNWFGSIVAPLERHLFLYPMLQSMPAKFLFKSRSRNALPLQGTPRLLPTRFGHRCCHRSGHGICAHSRRLLYVGFFFFSFFLFFFFSF